MIKAEDEPKLQKVGRYVLRKYEREAPPEAREVWMGAKWQRNHIALTDMNRNSIQDVCYSNSWSCINYRIDSSDPAYVKRPWGHHRAQLGYHDHERGNEVRLAYHNDALPWIKAYHSFPIRFHYPKSADTAAFTFPPGTPPGQYGARPHSIR